MRAYHKFKYSNDANSEFQKLKDEILKGRLLIVVSIQDGTFVNILIIDWGYYAM